MIVDALLSKPVAVRKAVAHLKRGDEALAGVIGKVGPYRMQFHPPTFPALARSIVFQQLNGRAASTIYGRFEEACGEVTPERVLKLRPARMRSLGLSERKTEYLRDLARQTRTGAIVFEELGSQPDDVVIAQLTQVRGIGEWTAHMFLMFALARPDVLPVGDYGIRQAMQRLYGLAELPKPTEMERIATPWRPWSSVACWYLWRSLDVPIEL